MKQKKIFNELIDERLDEILKLSAKIDYGDLTYHRKGKSIYEHFFDGFDNAFSFLKNIRDRKIMLEKTKK